MVDVSRLPRTGSDGWWREAQDRVSALERQRVADVASSRVPRVRTDVVSEGATVAAGSSLVPVCVVELVPPEGVSSGVWTVHGAVQVWTVPAASAACEWRLCWSSWWPDEDAESSFPPFADWYSPGVSFVAGSDAGSSSLSWPLPAFVDGPSRVWLEFASSAPSSVQFVDVSLSVSSMWVM